MGKDESPVDVPPDGSHRTYETQYAGQRPTVAIVEGIAAMEGVSPLDVDFTLNEMINPDALNTLFDVRETDEESKNNVVAEFHVENFAVTVDTDGTLTIEEGEEPE